MNITLILVTASAPADEEEVDWSSDSEDESAPAKSTTKPTEAAPKATATPDLAKSQITIKPTDTNASADALKPAQPRRSNDEKSVADSDASYDLVSGATSRAPSRAPGSPKAKAVDTKKAVEEESEDDDWE